MKKAILAVCMTLLIGAVLAGCSSRVRFEPEESSIFIQRDGGVTGYTKEEGYDKDYYSLDELRDDYVVPAVTAYNSEQANLAFAYADDTEETLPVALEELALEDGVAEMRLEYATAADYLGFNANQLEEDAVFAVSDLAEAAPAEDVSWVNASDGASVDEETALEAKNNYYYVELSFAATVQVEGKLVYLSDNVTSVDDNTFTTDGNGFACAVFRK